MCTLYLSMFPIAIPLEKNLLLDKMEWIWTPVSNYWIWFRCNINQNNTGLREIIYNVK